MTKSKVSVAEARRRADAQAWTVRRILDSLESLPSREHKFWAYLHTIRDELVPALVQVAQEHEGYVRLYASVLLLNLDEPTGADRVVSCLRNGDVELQRRTLIEVEDFLRWRRSDLGIDFSSYPQRPPLTANQRTIQERIFAELKRFLSQLDTEMGALALDAVLEMDLPEALTFICSLVTHTSHELRLRVLHWLAWRREDCGGLEIAEDFLFGGGQANYDDQTIKSLSLYCGSGKSELLEKATEILIRYIRTHIATQDEKLAGHVWNALDALDALEHVHPPEEKQFLEVIVQTTTDEYRKGNSLRRLGELEGEAGIARLQAALTDPALREYAAQGLAKIANSRKDEALVVALVEATQDETRYGVLNAIAHALMAIDDDLSRQAILPLADKLQNLYDRASIHWFVNKITPRIAIERLVQAGAIPPPPQIVIDDYEGYWQKDHDALSILGLFGYSQRLTYIPMNEGFPTDYVRLIDDLLKMCKGVFDIEAVSQQSLGGFEGYEITYIFNQKAYMFKARELGRAYDVGALLRSFNGNLQDTPKDQRFIIILAEGGFCCVTFAPEKAFLEAAEYLQLPIQDDPDWHLK